MEFGRLFKLMDQKNAELLASLSPRQLLFVIGFMWSRLSLLSDTATADDVTLEAWTYAALHRSQAGPELPDITPPSQGGRSGGAPPVALP